MALDDDADASVYGLSGGQLVQDVAPILTVKHESSLLDTCNGKWRAGEVLFGHFRKSLRSAVTVE